MINFTGASIKKKLPYTHKCSDAYQSQFYQDPLIDKEDRKRMLRKLYLLANEKTISETLERKML